MANKPFTNEHLGLEGKFCLSISLLSGNIFNKLQFLKWLLANQLILSHFSDLLPSLFQKYILIQSKIITFTVHGWLKCDDTVIY